MLRRLSVENYVLIDKLEMELDPHLNIITGETGAGKSILLGALGLLLGAKNDGSAMKDAARNCVVEGTFDLSGRDMEAFFAGNDLDYAPETTVTRMITPTGKSRAFINDLPVQLAQLREFGTRLIDIHSQHQNLILSSEEFRTSALDTVAGNGELLAQYAAQYTRLTELRRRLAALREAGVAYPNDFVRTDLFGDIRAKYQDATAEELEELKPEVACSGRMMLKRIMGKASFATVRDFTGDMQYFITKGDIGEEAYAAWKTFDLGDIVAVKGTLFRTKTGELSIRAHELRLMTKNIRPLPDKHKGLVDTEMCYRQRYVDLIMNEDSRNRFLVRSKAIAAIRSFMLAHRFLEVETPMLHPIPGGANAKPFITHHNALDMDMYLRIAPELYLKRLVVGGFERVFEINRNFRNEGVSVRHNPEFTMMEFYCTYWTYRDQMQFTEDLLRTAAREATGSAILPYQGHEIDLEKPFDRLTPVEAILKYSPDYTAEQLADEAFLRAELVRLGEPQPDYVGLGALQMALFEETTEAKLIQPTFIIDYPTEISPLARASDANHDVTERFELFIAGRELGNGFSELNDPDDQAARFKAQADAKSHGDDEAMYYDADYIRALEYGLPPTAGCGVGIDRFIMLLTDAPTIRDVLLFPHMRPESGN